MGASLRAVKLPASTGALGSVAAPGGTFGGFTVHATGAAAAIVRFWDNTSAAGTLLAVVELTSSGVGSWALIVIDPVFVTTGIWVEYVTGTVEGSVYVG